MSQKALVTKRSVIQRMGRDLGVLKAWEQVVED
jgi:hypothetical protein